MFGILEYIPYTFISIFNPFKLNGSSHPNLIDKSISVLRVVGWFFIFIQILIEHSVSKQWRT